MEYLRSHIIRRIVGAFLALQILNLSVDTRDIEAAYMPEDLSKNDVESILEWVLEDLLDIENAVEEYEDADDTEDSKSPTPFKLYCSYTLSSSMSFSEWVSLFYLTESSIRTTSWASEHFQPPEIL
ncbi:MAG: hypothetical protein SF053_10615 [Bacteroidia bacterium]|nr:hypothetical protein [Bacteroidia bacterium]